MQMDENIDRLAHFLQARRPAAFCDDCLATAVPIANRRQVQQLTSKLTKQRAGFFTRGPGTCSRTTHGQEKLVTRAV
jgi:hypothetical protein